MFLPVSPHRRQGVTFIELLVVSSILAVLIGMLLPALQKVRESAAKVRCAARLRQLGLASLTAHDAMGSLAPLVGTYPDGGTSFGTYFFHLLPFVEQRPLYELGYADGSYSVANNGVYARPVDLFTCPSDPSVPPTKVALDLRGVGWGVSSYAVNAQIVCTVTRHGKLRTFAKYARLPWDIPDGTSNTILLTEKYAQCFDRHYPAGGCLWPYYLTGSGAHAHHTGFAISWNAYSYGPTSKFLTQPSPYNGGCDPTLASSPHPGGIHIGLADGSVRFLPSTVTMYTWWYLCTPDGGEEFGPDAL